MVPLRFVQWKLYQKMSNLKIKFYAAYVYNLVIVSDPMSQVSWLIAVVSGDSLMLRVGDGIKA